MKRNTENKNNPQEKNISTENLDLNENSNNPFQHAQENKGDDASLTDDAAAEQQRKEALTERD
ncbi:MAG: hypothetical protein ICV65_05770 [Flavisolibacter sp.]|nr:hypothetical protein [Flavisolibacter sp.]MBD0350641.1 hypothetical protein [Flavisolibacter sp.]